MQPRDRERAPGLDLAGDIGVVERAFGFERDEAGLGIGLVALVDRRLQRTHPGAIHDFGLALLSLPAKAGNPVAIDASYVHPTQTHTGSSAFADDDRE